MIESDEEDINDIKVSNNYFIKISSDHSNPDSISDLNENISTYMGVKTIKEGTVADNEEINEKNKNKKHKKKKSKKTKKKRKKNDSFSSYSSSSSSSFSPSSSSPSSSSSESKHSSPKKKIKKKKKKGKKTNNKKHKKEKKEIEKNEENEENKNKEEEDINMEIDNEIKNNEIETTFEWDEGGNIVFVTGSFCDWNQFFLLKKNDEGKYSVTLPLPRGFHQYKFKVDDNWTYSKKQPKFEDNGNVNNFIDTTDYLDQENNNELNNNNEQQANEEKENNNEILQEKSNESIKEREEEKEREGSKDHSKGIIKTQTKEKSKENKKKKHIKFKEVFNENKITELKRNSSSHNIHFLNVQSNYSIYYPLRSEFSKKPSALPGLYKTYYILNEKKNKKKVERKFSQIEYVDSTNNSIQDSYSEISQNQSFNNSLYIINDINPYVKFHNLYHIHSNHLHSKEAIYKKTTVTSIISRYRFKFSTFIYYKESKPKVELDKKKHSKTVRIKRGKTEKIKDNNE